MATYDIKAKWTPADLAHLMELHEWEASLPPDAPRALLSVRLSVLTDNTTSPVRQELDLRRLASEKGYRVIGVASDLNVSATKVPPWKRKALGTWLNDRIPEFDAILFWKLDRFIRRMSDLSTMIEWCEQYGKNLVSRNDTIDLSTPDGRLMARLIGGLAEIEAANTSTRSTSLWDYARTQTDWLVGKPPYGYMPTKAESGRTVLAIDPDAARSLSWARRMALRGVSARRMAHCLVRSGLMSPGLTTATLIRRLRNPALLGYRVEENKQGGKRRSRTVRGRDGRPMLIAPPIFTVDEYDTLQAALDVRGKDQPPRRSGGATQFLGVLICADCSTNMTVQKTRRTDREYTYLRCRKCKSGGLGAPDPQGVYGRLVQEVLSSLGDIPVQVREYTPGTGGGSTRDRWTLTYSGKTFREAWEAGGMAAMAEDLRRAGITCEVTRQKVKGVRAPSVGLRLKIPHDVRAGLVVRQDAFAANS
ncbi:recombinase family protein [Streptomyces boninensis]|uniref:recombinase family protein n=1 Tax=Streptomyces boninensis TaxID=2039455 RepID=UPI003B20DA10